MGLFRQFPYTNFHELNMDQILKIMREMQDEWDFTKNQWESYKDFIDNYFANLDLDAETLKAIQAMAASGDLNTVIDPVIVTETARWLAENITPTTPVIDKTLSIPGAGADAHVVGFLESNQSGGNYTFASRLYSINTILRQYLIQNGVSIYSEASGRIWIRGTATANVMKLPLTTSFAPQNIYVEFNGTSSHSSTGARANVSLYDPLTDTVVSNAVSFRNDSGRIVGTLTPTEGTTNNVVVILYVRSGATVNLTLNLNDVLINNRVPVPYAEAMGPVQYEPSLQLSAGDKSLIIDTNVPYDRLFTMPCLYNFGSHQIDYDNHIVHFNHNNTILTPHAYYAVSDVDVEYGTDDMIYHFLYHYDTGTITSHRGNYTGNSLVLFSIYRDRLISQYAELYDKSLITLNIGYLGDSITAGVGAGGINGSYTEIMRLYYRTLIYNYGLSGSAITEEAGVSTNNFIERVPDMVNDLDIVCFMGGTNDYWRNLPLGSITDTVNTTFYGALNNLCEALQTKYPEAFIYCAVPPMGYNPDNNFDMGTKSNIGSFFDMCNAIKEVADKYGIPYLDLPEELSINPRNTTVNTKYYSDGVHMNSAGQHMLAMAHRDFINRNILKIKQRIK